MNGYNAPKTQKPDKFKLSKLQVMMLIFMTELITWTDLHNNEQTAKLTIVDEREFVKDMLRKINLKIVYFKTKLGIG